MEEARAAAVSTDRWDNFRPGINLYQTSAPGIRARQTGAMACAYCGSDIECPYIVEWVDDDPCECADDDVVCHRRRPRGTLVTAVPMTPYGIAVIDIPTSRATHFNADPSLWDATLFAMATRRRATAPCINFEHPDACQWASHGILGALLDHARIAGLFPAEECTFTSTHAQLAWARLGLAMSHAEDCRRKAEDAKRLAEAAEEDAMMANMSYVVTTGIPGMSGMSGVSAGSTNGGCVQHMRTAVVGTTAG